ncbi:hypothetical protein CRP01_06725 [Flavilitoribacter nigricans DSM 23189 = NBRC 102662]|uniref:T9SS type A sorting domain-containing protein n=2 Tax=Flavilitoribacter TaxID=2762562 RepID=A0A2D0NGL9_FLAN2|nr:hypothetical protein CRP01_06725 [Flavilitoribacter nigricans DSM 23189 = NBRC 102662]
MRREAPIIHYEGNKVRGRGEAASTDTVPVFFTVFRNDDGSFADQAIDATLADQALEHLNQYFQPIRIVFVRLGEINYIDNTIFTDFSRHHHLARFSYLSSALNLYSRSGSGSFAQFPTTLGPTADYSPTLSSNDRSNMISLNSHHFTSTSFAHEVGHSYGLLHTFEGAQVYNNPADPTPGLQATASDHPYGQDGNSRRRELVIRKTDEVKVFSVPNGQTAGDFVEDTPAFCVSTNTFPDYYPDVQASQCDRYPYDPSRCNGCIVVDCDYRGNYIDYNGDTLVNTEVSIRNLMSYTNCRTEFTPGQYERMAFYHEQVRKQQYRADRRLNFSDTVFFADSRIPMDDIIIQVSHPGNSSYANATTNSAGAFQAILYEPSATVRLMKAGTALDPDYQLSPWVQASVEEIIAHSYHPEDWRQGIDQADLDRLQRHLSGTQLLNGYQQLAADLDADGQLTQSDLQLMEALTRAEINRLEAHPAPWQFLPAYIPEQYADNFHQDPFSMIIDGVAYQHFAPYTEADWLYRAGDLPQNQQGFRTIKLGDLDGSSVGAPTDDTDGPETPPTGTKPDDTVKKFACFPNPTAGDITVAFQATEAAEATLLVTNRFFRAAYRQELYLEKGHNEITVDGTSLASGLLVVMLKTPEGIFYKKVIKVNSGN